MMKRIAKKILAWNRAFDKIPEPKRLLMFIALALPGIITVALDNSWLHSGWLWFGGLSYLLILLFLRWAFIEGHLVKYIGKEISNG